MSFKPLFRSISAAAVLAFGVSTPRKPRRKSSSGTRWKPRSANA